MTEGDIEGELLVAGRSFRARALGDERGFIGLTLRTIRPALDGEAGIGAFEVDRAAADQADVTVVATKGGRRV